MIMAMSDIFSELTDMGCAIVPDRSLEELCEAIVFRGHGRKVRLPVGICCNLNDVGIAEQVLFGP